MNTLLLTMLPAAFMTTATLAAQDNPVETHPAKSLTIRRMTPNLYTDDVAACVRFWVERLHFEKTVSVPDGEKLAFAAVQKANIELMYGSYASLDKDAATARAYQKGTSFLFLEVEDINGVLAAMAGAPIVTPIHKTFYGATEFTVKDPAGNLITFAQFENS